ncbi:MAG: hypothetical protein ACREJ3_20145 [Polyangiaceae bacterium]
MADRINRRLAYAIFGAIGALCALGMMLAPATPAAFTVGCLAYQFANGLAYAAFYAFVFELVGKSTSVTTQISLYAGASNLAVTYVTWFDGYGYDNAKALLPARLAAGRFGMLGMDVASTVLGLAALSVMTICARRARH